METGNHKKLFPYKIFTIYFKEDFMKKRALLSLCVLLLTGGATVNAEVYELNPVVVTASRVEKKEFDT